MLFDILGVKAKQAGESAKQLLALVEIIDGNRASDQEIQDASILCEESNKFIAEWAETEKGKAALYAVFEKHEQTFEDLHDQVVLEGPKAVIEDRQGALAIILDCVVDHNPGFDADLARKAMDAWKEFFLAHDHGDRLIDLLVVA